MNNVNLLVNNELDSLAYILAKDIVMHKFPLEYDIWLETHLAFACKLLREKAKTELGILRYRAKK